MLALSQPFVQHAHLVSSRRCCRPSRFQHRPQALLAQREVVNVQGFRIRKMDAESEVPAVAAIQAEGFVEPWPLLGQLQLNNFKAEVLDVLRKKMRSTDDDSFVVLVVEDPQGGNLCGVVELSLESDTDVLVQLGRQDPYAYVSCMAVLPTHRRKGAASALLKAAEGLVGRWRQRCLVLHVYEDNARAVALYEANGYRVVSSDPAWKRMLPGARVRLLMTKSF